MRRSDERLALAVQAGDAKAAEELVLRYQALAAFIARPSTTLRSDSDDIRQEALISILAAARSYRVAGGASFRWLLGLAIRRRLYTVIKADSNMSRKAALPPLPLQLIVELDDNETTLEEAVADKHARDPHWALERREELAAVVEVFTYRLSDRQKAAVTGFVNGETYLETAERLGLPAGESDEARAKAVDNALHLARSKVKRALVALEADARPLEEAA